MSLNKLYIIDSYYVKRWGKLARKKICKYCQKLVDENHVCHKKSNKQYNKYKRDYYKKNKEIVAPIMSYKWKKFRKFILERDDQMCQRCYAKYGIINGDELQAHHIKSRINYPELMYDENNVITVCKTCNLQLGTSDKLDFEWKNDKNVEIRL